MSDWNMIGAIKDAANTLAKSHFTVRISQSEIALLTATLSYIGTNATDEQILRAADKNLEWLRKNS